MGIISSVYKKTVLERSYDDGSRKFFGPEDYKGMHADAYSFKSEGRTLRGNFYYYDDCTGDELIILCHGIGGCARTYMNSIDILCKAGLKVLAYDNTGSYNSDGDSLISLSHSLVDLNSAVESLKENGELGKYKKIYAIGHSWGGYAVSNIANYQDCFDKIVVISGFRKVKTELEGFAEAIPKIFRPLVVNKVYKYEKAVEPDFCESDSLNAVNEGKTRFMFVHSKDDPIVPFEGNTKYIIDNTSNKDVRYLILEDKKHHPFYTPEAVVYKDKTFGKFNTKRKHLKPEEAKAFRDSVDWDLVYAQDLSVWEQITDFLKEE